MIIPEELIYFSYGLGLCILLTFISIMIDFIGIIIKSILEKPKDLSGYRNKKIEKII
jgi:hypothetical protein